MYDRILLATDGTVASENASSHAIDLAAAHDADLHVLYVVDENIYTAYSADEYVDEAEGPEHGFTEHGRETLETIRANTDERGVEVTTALQYGDPVETIIDYEDKQDVNLIVLGTKRRSEEYRALLGSTTDRVLRLTTRPALIVKTGTDDQRQFAELCKILKDGQSWTPRAIHILIEKRYGIIYNPAHLSRKLRVSGMHYAKSRPMDPRSPDNADEILGGKWVESRAEASTTGPR